MDTYSEQYRHQCEVRALLSARRKYGPEWLREWLRDPFVAKRKAALIRDIKDQLDKGSTGEHGEWL